MDPRKIEAKITKKTRAIIPVHLFGHPAEMDPILELARKYHLKVIEDCAQAFGAVYQGKKVGTLGDCGCFSFFPSKNLAGYGDGGMVITQNQEMGQSIKMLRNHGSKVKYYHSVLGYNSRLDEIQAAIIRVKFKHMDDFNAARRRHADLYRTSITGEDIILPLERSGCHHVYHQFTLRSKYRDQIMASLHSQGIASAIYYPVPLHRQEVFAGYGSAGEILPHAETCIAEVLSLPMFPELKQEEIQLISDVINHVS
jgi:dTDP-4-amino-4,6-dideoxygalactose transaminase